MSKFFSVDNPLWTVVGRIFDVFVLHTLWLVCSLPIFTFGGATIALHYALMKDVSDENPHYVKAFFRSFKENLKQGVLVGLIFLIGAGGLIYGAYIYGQMNWGIFGKFLTIFSIVLAVCFVLVYQYVWPLLARFNNTTKNTFKNAVLFTFRHAGWSIVMGGVTFAWYYCIIRFFAQIAPLLILGYGFVVYVNSYILNHILKPYIQEAERAQYGDPDAWTVPDENENNSATQREEK